MQSIRCSALLWVSCQMALAGVALAGVALAGVARAGVAVSINEIRIDQPGGDASEYFELVGAPGASLDGLSYVVIGDGVGGSGVIDAVVDLSGTTIPADGFFLATEATFENGAGETFEGVTPDLVTVLDFENSDNVTHLLVSGFTGLKDDDLDTDDDGVLDAMPWTSLVDGVALVEEPNPPTETEYEYGTDLGLPLVGPDGPFVPGHVFRETDGIGPFAIGVFSPGETDTPGATNVVVPEPSSLLLAFLTAALAMVGCRPTRRR